MQPQRRAPQAPWHGVHVAPPWRYQRGPYAPAAAAPSASLLPRPLPHATVKEQRLPSPVAAAATAGNTCMCKHMSTAKCIRHADPACAMHVTSHTHAGMRAGLGLLSPCPAGPLPQLLATPSDTSQQRTWNLEASSAACAVRSADWCRAASSYAPSATAASTAAERASIDDRMSGSGSATVRQRRTGDPQRDAGMMSGGWVAGSRSQARAEGGHSATACTPWWGGGAYRLLLRARPKKTPSWTQPRMLRREHQRRTGFASRTVVSCASRAAGPRFDVGEWQWREGASRKVRTTQRLLR
eukprot:355351-Chlamydomonas_euryale.AAC.5